MSIIIWKMYFNLLFAENFLFEIVLNTGKLVMFCYLFN